MSFASQFLGGGQPVGSIVQAPYNITDAAWLPCQGQRILRATYPQMSACQPTVGVFTATQRTKGAATSAPAICAHGANFVLAATGPSANGIYTTTDALTYTLRTTPNASVVSLISDGTNVVAANNGSLPLYSTDAGVTWAASATSAIAGNYGQQTMAYAPSLGANGRFLLLEQATGTVWTSDNRGVTWTSRVTGLGVQLAGVCWTGSRYMAVTTSGSQGLCGVSADGITWSLQIFPMYLSTSLGIVSDGAGRVLIVDSLQSLIATSQDHGATFARRSFGNAGGGGVMPLSITASFANARFFVTTNSLSGNPTAGFLCSADLQSWTLVPDVYLLGAINQAANVAFKSGVYVINGIAAILYSLTEDTTRMYLPSSAQAEALIGGSGSGSSNNFIPYVKVQ